MSIRSRPTRQTSVVWRSNSLSKWMARNTSRRKVRREIADEISISAGSDTVSCEFPLTTSYVTAQEFCGESKQRSTPARQTDAVLVRRSRKSAVVWLATEFTPPAPKPRTGLPLAPQIRSSQGRSRDWTSSEFVGRGGWGVRGIHRYRLRAASKRRHRALYANSSKVSFAAVRTLYVAGRGSRRAVGPTPPYFRC